MPQMNMQQIMKQAQKMQKQLEEQQEKAKDIEVSASAGGGMVKVSATGELKLKEITIDPEAVDPDDVDLLQDMILAAVNEALSSAQDAMNKQMTDAMGLGGMNIPGLF